MIFFSSILSGCITEEVSNNRYIEDESELLDPEERTVERWLQLLGDDAEFNQSKSKLIELQNSLKDINSSDSSN